MRIRLLGFIFFGFSILSFGQNQTLVFNDEGKIIKNYGYERSQKNQMEMKFLIEKPMKSGEYYLAWQWRNEYNLQANVVYQNNFNIEKFNSGRIDSLPVFNKLNADQRFFSFLLIKTNEKGASILNGYLDGEKKFSIDELSEKSKVDYLSFFTFKEKVELLNPLDSILKLRTSLDAKKKDITAFNKTISLEIQKLKSQIGIKKLTLEKLSLVDQAQTTPQLIKEISIQLDSLSLVLVKIQSQKTADEKKLNNEKKEIESNISKINKRLKRKFVKKANNSVAKYDFLRQGIIISKNHETREIVYDANYGKLFKSDIENLKVARLTPNLPQLTTDSELYFHVINLKREKLDANPFVISMTSEQSEPVEIESPSNVKTLENIDDFDIFEELISSEDVEAGLVFKFNIEEFLAYMDSYYNEAPEKRKTPEFYQPFIGNLLPYVQLAGLDNDIEERIKKFESDFDDDLMSKLLLAIEKQLNAEIDKRLKKVSLAEYEPKSILKPVFTEFLVKYPRPFEASRKPTIKLLSNQYTTENYIKKVTEGEAKKESYDIKFDNIELVSDELPPVHRLFRFSINAGALITNNISYNYEQIPVANSNTNDLIEKKDISIDIRPSLTFSTYFLKQDVAVNTPLDEILKTTHFDISVDYADSKILDNVYLGLGIEPIRNLHLAGGIRIGEIERIDRDNYDSFKPIVEQDTNSKINMGGYFSISLGFNLVPKFINMIIKK